MDIEEAYAGLEKAHAAGDRATAQRLADYIRAEQAKVPKDSISAVPVHPVEAVAEAASGWSPSTWFQSKDPKEMSLEEAAGKVSGGAAAGAAAGAVMPGLLKGAGKLVPGAIGKLLTGLGEGMGALPLKERVVKGAGGGAAMGATEALGEALGAPPALTAAGSLVAGGTGEAAASFLTKETGALLKFVGNLGYGHTPGMARALGGMLSPNKQLNEATALKLQKKLFGDKTGGYVNGLIGSEHRVAAQEALRKADPSLLAGPKAPAGGLRPMWESSTGEMESMGAQSMGRDLAAATGQRTPPAGFAPPGQPPLLSGAGGPKANPLAEPVPLRAQMKPEAETAGMAAGKAGAKAKRTAAQLEAEKQEAAAAEAALKPASQLYRERLYQGVTQGVKEGKTFSSTPEYAQFQKELEHQVTMGSVGKAEAAELLRKLRLDRAKGSGNERVLGDYAKMVDDQIRQWGKPAEGAAASGAAVIDRQVAADVRSALQRSFNGYTEKLGLGKVEQQYRKAYSTEMIAQAKDELPHFLYKGFGKEKEFAKMVRNLEKDPEAKPFIQATLARHLANQEPKAIVGEFERLQSVLVNAKLLNPADLKQLRSGVEVVKSTAESGLKQKRMVTLRNMMMMAMARKAGIEAGGAAGAAGAAEAEEE